jgi:hypothetical protein
MRRLLFMLVPVLALVVAGLATVQAEAHPRYRRPVAVRYVRPVVHYGPRYVYARPRVYYSPPVVSYRPTYVASYPTFLYTRGYYPGYYSIRTYRAGYPRFVYRGPYIGVTVYRP